MSTTTNDAQEYEMTILDHLGMIESWIKGDGLAELKRGAILNHVKFIRDLVESPTNDVQPPPCERCKNINVLLVTIGGRGEISDSAPFEALDGLECVKRRIAELEAASRHPQREGQAEFTVDRDVLVAVNGEPFVQVYGGQSFTSANGKLRLTGPANRAAQPKDERRCVNQSCLNHCIHDTKWTEGGICKHSGRRGICGHTCDFSRPARLGCAAHGFKFNSDCDACSTIEPQRDMRPVSEAARRAAEKILVDVFESRSEFGMLKEPARNMLKKEIRAVIEAELTKE